MKKFTFLLTLLGLSASSAFAGVFTPSTDSESHLFAIKNPNNNYYSEKVLVQPRTRVL